jgi:hypothetical protein
MPDETVTAERLRLLSWAIERSDDLRNAYAQRGVIMLAACGFILAGLTVLIKGDVLSALGTTNAAIVTLFAFIVIFILWSVLRAVWHVLRSTVSTFESSREHVYYLGPPRYWLNPTDTLGRGRETRPRMRSGVVAALVVAPMEVDVSPDTDQLNKLRDLDFTALADGWVGELCFDLQVQDKRYQRLGWAALCVACAFAAYLVLVIVAISLLVTNAPTKPQPSISLQPTTAAAAESAR